MKTAVVVGGGQTLGEYLCKGLAEAGYKVGVADLNGQNATKVADDICTLQGQDISVGVSIDATDEQSVVDAFRTIKEQLGSIDVLVYSAGVAKATKITEFTLKDFNFNVNVNLNGYFLCAREAARYMVQQGNGGRIIQINSKSGKVGSKHNAGYSSAKFGGVGLTQSIALDLADDKITVNSLMLGNLLESPMFQSLIPQYAKKLGLEEHEVMQHYIDKVPLKAGCGYDDVLNVLKFYISDGAKYCTGQSINITGGQVMF
ncbi:sorbitol-6-phosphate 2-dehydrogenase [Vibrio cholerae]|uniref:sorbitol-6-phosphate dehydrogenase n=1 Tax=Vibrio cholerae TaxID=666 RepID=UPI001A2B9585|nr:sorbitol-6-phosphate dehydrogenase [Vibrio cholerae]EJL6701003.1 sorbitol-6-phosphate dehydrogenase [Vibrio cholerae]MCD1221457.1 sorbitol-6-phosphate 2-dehydrogenase [Vibrio cholerae]MCD1250696.1 sorbitol-6-phosphate 2-dehydrogenase [Vibrio cholerae]HAS3568131.1 sorbitol-6-phosphate dehydrogenase [Vibrio cholerae]